MKTTAEAVKHVINAGGVDTLLALDNGTGDKCGYIEGNASELAAYVDFLESNMLVPYRIQLSSSKVDRKRGNKSAQDRPYVFLLLGRSGQQMQPVNAAPVAQPQSVPLELAKEAAANGVRNEMLTASNAELQERLKLLEDRLAEEEEEEEDEDDEPVNATPAPRSAFEDPEVVKEIIGIFKPIGQAAAAWITGGMKPKERVTTTAEAVATAGDSLTDEERRALIAMRNAKRENPELARQYITSLIDNYAATEPEANGKA